MTDPQQPPKTEENKVFIDDPADGAQIGMSFAAVGRYQTSGSSPQVKLSFEGSTAPPTSATMDTGDQTWQAALTAPMTGSVVLKAELFVSGSSTPVAHTSISLTVTAAPPIVITSPPPIAATTAAADKTFQGTYSTSVSSPTFECYLTKGKNNVKPATSFTPNNGSWTAVFKNAPNGKWVLVAKINQSGTFLGEATKGYDL